jgi:hypothetical protein
MKNFIGLICLLLVSTIISVSCNSYAATEPSGGVLIEQSQPTIACTEFDVFTLEGLPFTATEYCASDTAEATVFLSLLEASEAEAVPIHIIEPYWTSASFARFRCYHMQERKNWSYPNNSPPNISKSI